LSDEPEIETTDFGGEINPYLPREREERDQMLRHNTRVNANNNHAEFHGDHQVENTARLRRPSGYAVKGKSQRDCKMLVNIRQRAKDIKSKLPEVKDVNNIDKYSRLMFPLLFLIFNAWYWVYYSVLSNAALTVDEQH